MFRLLRKALFFILTFSFMICPMLSMTAYGAERLQDVSEKLVIVIDPGHGGENLGTVEGEIDEKYMTLTTAMAMYEELSLYDDVEVYLTRTDDSDLTLKERAEFANSVNADFLFSIHFNASEYHEYFGAEIWIPSQAPFNNYGYQFGYEFLSGLRERGLFIRGIKTRLNDKGLDYYGIIRETAALEIPAVILEHCHVDESRDLEFCNSEEDFIRFGKDDATAAAKYLGLKSSILNVDYSDYSLAETDGRAPIPETQADETPPDVCMIEFISADYEKGSLSLSVSAADYDSMLLYYDYSIDGGLTYSKIQAWPGSNALDGSYEDTFTLNLDIPDGSMPIVTVRAYNLFNLLTESNRYVSQKAFIYPKETLAEDIPESQDATASSETENKEPVAVKPTLKEQPDSMHEIGFISFLEICLIIVTALFLILLFSQIISYHSRKRRRRQRRNDSGETKNQHR